ncbi:uncharacterized protein LOC127127913 [Lathyrus oleraceus]|uniref:uncharacterized protein LOC127127911 n=1 Tax=Pisum sativum TaxID=3888 RepID=UPI0021D0E03F|nr:uncharacterized protein LOC127127911 [Pisum sativum]XP_050913143.1 uncharacterized protein LOC127127911 [Pisum sativum]XP_050913144.1 uncharacterized protein LOC127127913 [Pisum sativum]
MTLLHYHCKVGWMWLQVLARFWTFTVIVSWVWCCSMMSHVHYSFLIDVAALFCLFCCRWPQFNHVLAWSVMSRHFSTGFNMLDSVVHGDSVNCQLQADFFLAWISLVLVATTSMSLSHHYEFKNQMHVYWYGRMLGFEVVMLHQYMLCTTSSNCDLIFSCDTDALSVISFRRLSHLLLYRANSCILLRYNSILSLNPISHSAFLRSFTLQSRHFAHYYLAFLVAAENLGVHPMPHFIEHLERIMICRNLLAP